jgi:hypothetical protein
MLLMLAITFTASSCDSNSAKTLTLPDMAVAAGDMATVQADMALPPLGCNGVELCAAKCGNSACIMACYNRVTDSGGMLDNTFYMCQITFCTTVQTSGDAGFSCNSADATILNGNGMGNLSMPCSKCLGGYGFTGEWSTYCAAQITACKNDLP